MSSVAVAVLAMLVLMNKWLVGVGHFMDFKDEKNKIVILENFGERN